MDPENRYQLPEHEAGWRWRWGGREVRRVEWVRWAVVWFTRYLFFFLM